MAKLKWKRVRAKQCAKHSFRVKKTASGTLLRFCCPKGKWKKGRCVGGMKLQAKAHASPPLGAARYPLVSKISKVTLKRRR